MMRVMRAYGEWLPHPATKPISILADVLTYCRFLLALPIPTCRAYRGLQSISGAASFGVTRFVKNWQWPLDRASDRTSPGTAMRAHWSRGCQQLQFCSTAAFKVTGRGYYTGSWFIQKVTRISFHTFRKNFGATPNKLPQHPMQNETVRLANCKFQLHQGC